MKTVNRFTGIAVATGGFALILALVVGCETTPKMPVVLDSNSPIAMYYTNDFSTDFNAYRAAFNSGNTNQATALRNAMINRIRVEIEGNYRDFEAKLFSDRQSFLTFSDFVELGLAGATTIAVGERTKTVLAAILTAVKGARLSVDKNWFREKNTEIVIASMQAERNKKLEMIEKKVTGNAMEYTFEEAWVDLIEYFYAGTLEAGVQALGVETGKNAADAKAATKQATQARIEKFTIFKATPIQISHTRALTQKVAELKQQNDVAEAKRILNELHITPGPDEQIFDQLQAQVRAASRKGPDAVDALMKPFGVE